MEAWCACGGRGLLASGVGGGGWAKAGDSCGFRISGGEWPWVGWNVLVSGGLGLRRWGWGLGARVGAARVARERRRDARKPEIRVEFGPAGMDGPGLGGMSWFGEGGVGESRRFVRNSDQGGWVVLESAECPGFRTAGNRGKGESTRQRG